MQITQTYEEFINEIINTRGRFGITSGVYKERHHIVPKCIGGSNEESNLIDLYAHEHFIAHQLLARENPDNVHLTYAYFLMSTKMSADTNERDYIVTPEEYEESRLLISNSYKFNPRSDEFRKNVSVGMKEYRSRVPFPEEHLRRIRESTNKHKEENRTKGLTLYGTPIRKNGELGALRQFANYCVAVKCVLTSGETYYFESIREASIW